ncbi:MAG: PilZ domain-containing protein [Tepidisphaeraceae bacterium]
MLTLSQPMAINEAGADSGIERRRGLRIQQTRPIKVFEPTGSRYFGGQTQDVSSTGLRLKLPASMPVRPGKLLSIHVGLSETGQTLANRRNMIPARVVWVNRPRQTDARTLSIGVEFLASISAQLDAA